MPARRAKPPTARRAVIIPPHEDCWIESDTYDRNAFSDLSRESPALAALAEGGGTLVPQFRALLEDLFCLLFKLAPVWRAPESVASSAILNRRLLETLRDHPLLGHLRAETCLDEGQAGLATVLLGEEVLALLREERLLPRGDLLDLWELAREEDTLRGHGDEVENLDELIRDSTAGDTARAALERARDEATRAAELAAARLRRRSAALAQRLDEMPARVRGALPAASGVVARQLGETASDAQNWGRGLGAGGRPSAAMQIELGRRLASNPKLRRLGALVGRMRALALALRRRSFERQSEEVHAVEHGRDLEHLLPPELLALSHPLLRRDFARRLVEGRLLSYELRGTDDRGRGPMIVCLDGSSSMAGDKEIWAKAVALTLLEIARRQRRLFRFIGFASADTPLYTLDLNPREHHTVQLTRALDVAEYFPGGGTDFETPLDAALDCLGAARYRRGDVVLITDGECQVSAAWADHFRAGKMRLGFTLFSVLIDVGPSQVDTLAALSDRVTSVSCLTDDGARDLFLAMR